MGRVLSKFARVFTGQQRHGPVAAETGPGARPKAHARHPIDPINNTLNQDHPTLSLHIDRVDQVDHAHHSIGTGNPVVDAIKRPDPPWPLERTKPRLVSEYTGLGEEVGIDQSRLFINLALARRFASAPEEEQEHAESLPSAPNLSPSEAADIDLSGTGFRFPSTQNPHVSDDIDQEIDLNLAASVPKDYTIEATPVIAAQAASRNEPASQDPISSKSAGKRPLLSRKGQHDAGNVGRPGKHTLTSVCEDLYQQRHPLGKDLNGELCRSRKYISDFRVWDTLTFSVVRFLLEECDELSPFGVELSRPRNLDQVADIICGQPKSQNDPNFLSYRKVFAALILCERAPSIFDFIQKGLHDGYLPLECFKNCSNPDRHGSTPCSSAAHIFQPWSSTSIERFDNYQWELCAPYFQLDQKMRCLHYKFSDRFSWPLKDENEILGPDGGQPGGFSKVFKVEIDENHHNFPIYTTRKEDKKQLFAIKKLDYQSQSSTLTNQALFQNETNILCRLTNLNIADREKSKHLSKLYATFETVSLSQTPSYFLIFPCADSNLKDFWLERRGSRDDLEREKKLSRWIAEQLCGLSEALHIIHDFLLYKRKSDPAKHNRGIHGDLKPENILYFSNWEGVDNEFGILQISDFGSARYHSDDSVDFVSPHLRRWHPYCPPEVELPWNIDQSVDVWALGCLFLDFLVWFLCDHEGIEQFKRSRKLPSLAGAGMAGYYFYDLDQRRGMFSSKNPNATLSIAAGVQEWTRKLQRLPHASQFIQDILEFVPTHMLVLEDRSAVTRPYFSTTTATAGTSSTSLYQGTAAERRQRNRLRPGNPEVSPSASNLAVPCTHDGRGVNCPQAADLESSGSDLSPPGTISQHHSRHKWLQQLPGIKQFQTPSPIVKKRLKSMQLHERLRKLCLEGKAMDDTYYWGRCSAEVQDRDIPMLRQTLKMSQTMGQLSAMSDDKYFQRQQLRDRKMEERISRKQLKDRWFQSQREWREGSEPPSNEEDPLLRHTTY